MGRKKNTTGPESEAAPPDLIFGRLIIRAGEDLGKAKLKTIHSDNAT